MAKDLLTGEHICAGLAIGQACDRCKAKYPHLLATTAEQIAAGRRHMDAAIEAYTGFIDGTRPTTMVELNTFAYGGDGTIRPPT